jgi:hypothetical protein
LRFGGHSAEKLNVNGGEGEQDLSGGNRSGRGLTPCSSSIWSCVFEDEEEDKHSICGKSLVFFPEQFILDAAV